MKAQLAYAAMDVRVDFPPDTPPVELERVPAPVVPQTLVVTYHRSGVRGPDAWERYRWGIKLTGAKLRANGKPGTVTTTRSLVPGCAALDSPAVQQALAACDALVAGLPESAEPTPECTCRWDNDGHDDAPSAYIAEHDEQCPTHGQHARNAQDAAAYWELIEHAARTLLGRV